ncbi:hypothetical protein [Shewanella colwelliana]|uniref:hypothetical protein n=1 Tax=Shewanella colwelliana TaxID=23 RepID=UPI0022AF5002|nr:hypothetical protein [Shewanella colwelliana]MCZ4337713.1 hypothetical protein [Shewanella colwelliana]
MTKRKWIYHYFRPTAGRAMYLLSADPDSNGPNEIELFEPIFFKLKHSLDKDLFNKALSRNAKSKAIIDINKQLKSTHAAIAAAQPTTEIDHPINALNDELNRMFSDDGWRQVRREMSQARKRHQTKTITISVSVYKDLLAYQKRKGFSTLDEAIDDLLPHEELNIQLTE